MPAFSRKRSTNNQGRQVADTDRAAVEQALVKNHVAATSQIAATMTLNSYPVTINVPVMQRVPDAMFEFGVITQALQDHLHDRVHAGRLQVASGRAPARTARSPRGGRAVPRLTAIILFAVFT